MAVPLREFIAAMRQLAAGVSLITTARGRDRAGLTATAVCSVSAEPPQLLACVNRHTEAHDLIREAGLFAVNVLASHQRPLAERFGGLVDLRGTDRFDAGAWTELVTGLRSSTLASPPSTAPSSRPCPLPRTRSSSAGSRR